MRDQALPGMHDVADALDRDGLALHRLGALGERRLVGDAGRLGDVLAQHQLDQRPVDQVGDRVHPLPLCGGAQEHRPGSHGEVRAAGENGVDRADPDDVAHADLQPLALEVPCILGEERRAECQRRGRQRQNDADSRLAGRGTKPNRKPESERESAWGISTWHFPNYDLKDLANSTPRGQSKGGLRRGHEHARSQWHEPRAPMARRIRRHTMRARGDQFLVLIALIAIWQVGNSRLRRLLDRLAVGRA